MGDFFLTVVIVGVWALGMLLFIGLCLFLPSIIRGFLGTDSHSVQRHVRQALDGAEIRIVQDDTEAPDGLDSSDYQDYLRWRRAQRQKCDQDMEEEVNVSHSPLEQLLRPSGAARKALHAAEMADIRAEQDELARQRDILRALDAQMNPPSPLATLSRHEREIARKQD